MSQSPYIQEICTAAPVVPVIVIEDAADAKPLAEALVAGGLPTLEVTLRTPAALEAIQAMRDVPGAKVGAGTVLDPDQLKTAKAAGATFVVSPGATPWLVAAAQEENMPLLPGAVSSSEVMALLAHGYSTLKFFPAEAVGGAPALKALAGPLPQVQFCPTGGVSAANAAEYLALPNVVCVGGSWVVSPDLVKKKDWAAIEALAGQAVTLLS